MKTLFDEMEHAVKNWWLSLILGILYIIVALCLLFAPGSSYIALSVIFSISMLISGIIEIIFSISNRRGISSWGWYLAGGIIDLILGIYLVAYPLLSMEVIPFIVAFWMMFRGFSATGILAIICSLIILWQPAVGALYVIYMLAFTFLIIGFFRVMLSFELKSLHKRSTVMNGK